MTSSDHLSYEAAAAARTLVERVMSVRPGETVLITGDDQGDARVVELAAQATCAAGAQPVVMRTARRPLDGVLPAPVAAAGAAADVWIDFAVQGAMYTGAQEAACAAGTRFGDFIEMSVESLVRQIGRVDYPRLLDVGTRFVEIVRPGATIRVTSEDGSQLSLTNGPAVATHDGEYAQTPGSFVSPPGLVTWTPVETSLDGTIVANGTIWPPEELGRLTGRVVLTVESGRIVDIDGDHEARSLRRWLQTLDSPDMLRVVHVSHGLHPNVRVFGAHVGENERLFGALTFGFGAWHGRPAPSHFDVMLQPPTVTIDGVLVQEGERFVDPELVARISAMSGSRGAPE